MTTIRIPDENMRFQTVRIVQLREDALFNLIMQGHISLKDFTQWVENTRDEWYAIGANSVDVKSECEQSKTCDGDNDHGTYILHS